MLTKSKIKLIRSLEMKKYRRECGLFVAEGPKVVDDMMRVYEPVELFATRDWMTSRAGAEDLADAAVTEVSEGVLERLSFLQHPQGVLALFRIPAAAPLREPGGLTLMLDGVQDPGNLGTIIRTADWFGVERVVCSRDSADVYNPKVVQATMGSIASVEVIYTDLEEYLSETSCEVCGTFLDGESIYDANLARNVIIVLGNEGKGVSEAVARRVTKRLTIPRRGTSLTAESLNVAVAAAIVCSEYGKK